MIGVFTGQWQLARRTSAGLLLVPVLSIWPSAAQAQLRVVTYNTTGAPRTGMDIVLKSIGEEQRNGIAKPIDILLLQEQDNSPSNVPSSDTQAFVTLLNTEYAGQGVSYDFGDIVGQGDTTQTIVFRTETVQLISENAFGPVGSSSSQQPRATLQYQIRPVGYDSTADFYAFNSHYKAGTASDDPNNPIRRNVEASSIRSRSNSLLGQGAHVIYAGDFNLYTAGEAAFQTLLSAGNGQAFDPLNLIAFDSDSGTKLDGEWSSNPAVAVAHTQSPCFSGCVGSTSGMDDRFDFQLLTGEFLDDEGLSLIGGSYHAFGNNGTTYNTNINAASNTTTFPGVTSYTKSQILNALWGVTDHLPVVADYQVPAIMQAIAGMVPATLDVGQVFNLDVTVSNMAPVLAAIGADELDYSLTTSGAVSGSFLNQMDAALGTGNTHLVALDTSTPGMKSGTITVSSASQQVQNGLINIPVSFQVLPLALASDYNGNGAVDAADYALWRDTLGLSVANGSSADGSGNGLVDEADYTVWQTHFGETSGSGTAVGLPTSAVPEPSAWAMLLIGVCLAGRRLGTLK